MLDICCFKWKPRGWYRSKFEGTHVNSLAAMIRRDYQRPHRFSCITDDPTGIDQNRVRVIPLWKDHETLPSAYGGHNPSCYRRLKIYSKEAAEIIGRRIACMDLDMVTTGNLIPILDRPEEIVLIKSATEGPRYLYNGSMVLMTAGARAHIWDTFDPIKSPAETVRRKFFGSDQAWISMTLGPGEATWDQPDGVYSYRIHLEKKGGILPANAKVVAFHGSQDPWGPEAQKLKWVRQHYASGEIATADSV